MKCFASLRRTLLKVFVEHLFPTRCMNVGGVRYHTVEVKKYGVVPLASDHAAALGLPHRPLSCLPKEDSLPLIRSSHNPQTFSSARSLGSSRDRSVLDDPHSRYLAVNAVEMHTSHVRGHTIAWSHRTSWRRSFTKTAIGSPASRVAWKSCSAPSMPILRWRPRHSIPNFRVLQLAGSFGLKAIPSLCNDNPAKPKTAVSQVPPRAAMCSPPAIAVWLSARSIAAACWKYRSARSESPSRAATSPCIAPLRELPWLQRGS